MVRFCFLTLGTLGAVAVSNLSGVEGGGCGAESSWQRRDDASHRKIRKLQKSVPPLLLTSAPYIWVSKYTQRGDLHDEAS